ncbi:hypothetical protein HN588_02320 [Candidatus Bathyarchaeota archaeon]|nr:hypothetical protein [Candidatus Bathyarchaeota archaeon]
MEKLIAWFLALALILVPVTAHGQETPDAPPGGQVTFVEEGDPAPFDGTLYDRLASAELIVRLESEGESCEIEIDRAVGANDVAWQLRYDQLDARYKISTETYDAKVAARDDMLSLQDEQLEKLRNPKSELVFAGGVVAGIGLTVLAGWAIGQAANAPSN